jgi:hypothetical protein
MNFWASFWTTTPERWEYEGPWWVTGETGHHGNTATSICLAVQAESEEQVRAIIVAAHGGTAPDEWRFVNPRQDDWTPYSNRFRPASWMRWPYPV